VVVQARTGSTRLPGKVLLPVAGAPVILRLLDRVLAARERFELVVATSDGTEDDALAEILALLDERPELARVNARYAGVSWYGVLDVDGNAATRRRRSRSAA
jgi:CMP-N-acetylneuraminic acid synthetase